MSTADRVEARERLVEDQHLGPVDQGRGELDPLLVAERKLLQVVPGPIGHTQRFELRPGRGAGFVGREAVEPGQVHDLVEHAHLGV